MLPALIIVFREAFEAFLIVAITFAYLKKTGRDALRPAVWWGMAVSLVASFVLGWYLQQINQPLWEGILALVAAALVATFVIHLWRVAPRIKQHMETKLERQASRGSAPLAWIGVFAFTVLMITREGMETALMLIQVRQGRFWLGCTLGLLCAAGLAWLWAHYGHRIDIRRFFQVTGLFFLLFTLQIIFYAVHEFSEAEILPNSETIHLLTEPYSADGRYSLWIMFGILAICAGWLATVTLFDRRRRTTPVILPGLLVLIALFAAPLRAATADCEASEPMEVGPDPVSIELKLPVLSDEITILGVRIAAAPERIPGSITVLSKETIDSASPAGVSEVLRKVPGVNVRDEEGLSLRPNIGLRGLSPTRSSKVLLLEDGLPLTFAPYGDNASYYHPPLERFESIEILKGSGQIAYGPMTVGGVINYLTPLPPAKPEMRVRIAGGNRGYFNGHLAWGGTFGKTGALFDVTRKQGDGARENLHTELNDVNAKVVQSFSDTQSLTLRANYYGEDSNVTYSGLRESEYAENPRQNPFRNDFFYGDRYGMSLAHRIGLSQDVWLATSVYGSKFKRHWWRQSSNSSQRPNDLADPNCAGMANLDTTCGNEGRLREYVTGGIEPRLRWTRSLAGLTNELEVGVRAHFEQQERRQLNGDSPRARTGRTVENNARDNQALSLFVQDRLTVGRWAVSPGVRVERIGYERLNRLANDRAGARGETSLTQVIPGLGVAWSTGATTIFAGIHRGFAPPRTEDVITNAGGVVELDPELSWNSELGLRLAPRPGVQIESTLFRMDYENQIVPASVAGGVGATLTNGGRTLHQGFELGGRFDTAAALGTAHNAYATLSYTFLEQAEFMGRRFSGVPGSNDVSISGNRLPYAPKHLLTAGIGYFLPRGIEAFVEAVHIGEQFGDDLNTVTPTPDGQRGLVPSSTIWNATLNYDVRPLGATVFVTMKNVFDELYITDRSRGILPGSPRVIQAGLSFKR